jgi:ATP adenylyltransferase
LERLWSPWRSQYVASGGGGSAQGRCLFCEIPSDPAKDEENLVVHRAALNYVLLNLFPYVSGHLLIVPYDHIPTLDSASKPITDELMDLTKRSQTILREVYQPDGFNVGMNLGAAAGAGVADHIHMHVLPRWNGDTNFMTTVSETRVLPEDLKATYQKLRGRFES